MPIAGAFYILGGGNMPNYAEVIEKLAKQLEQQKILSDLRSCETLEDFKKLTEKYETICKEQN